MKLAFMTATNLRAIASGVLIATALVSVPLRASAGTLVGTVMHVSTTDIEVQGQHGKTLRFVIAPEFNKIFSSDGKTTVQMTRLKPGTPVTVQYHDTIGILHPDKITVNK
jgi:hypothetical protein